MSIISIDSSCVFMYVCTLSSMQFEVIKISKSCGRCGPRGSTDSDRKPLLREDGGCAPSAVTSQHIEMRRAPSSLPVQGGDPRRITTMELLLRPLQYDSMFPLSSESLGHAGGRFIIHYSLSLHVLERQQH